jgi:hypothetical protein
MFVCLTVLRVVDVLVLAVPSVVRMAEGTDISLLSIAVFGVCGVGLWG